MMARMALGLSYDGSGWHGWQSQVHGQTVQDALEGALAAFVGSPVRTHCAGRTDTGVHAAMQVVHFDSPVERPLNAWVRGLNAHLPRSVAIRWAQPVSQNFHARFSATGRRYVYRLLVSPVRSPLWAGRAGWCFRPLAVDAMRQAAMPLIGRHDFSSFRSAQCQASTPVRDLHQLDILEHGRFVFFSLHANAFLHHMVRNLVGSLIYVGLGREAPEWLQDLLCAKDRTQAAPTFSPEGLYLTGVDYPDNHGLPPLDVSDEIRHNV